MTMFGHHHISMITKNAQDNNRFYTEVLGLRRVNVTVNQDSPNMYHLFYGDKTGAPGTELTFFEIPMVGRTHRGTNAITRIGLLVPNYNSLVYWEERLAKFGVKTDGIGMYAGKAGLEFEDGEGLRFVLLNHQNQEVPESWQAWNGSDVEAEHQILGMGSIELTVKQPGKTIELLEAIFEYEIVEEKGNWTRIQTKSGGIFSEIILFEQDGVAERAGRGSIHHLALRATTIEQLSEWNEAVLARGIGTSGEIDRHYFRSIYFRDDNNILFEIATDEPGFVHDGNDEELGETLNLPPALESRRTEIEAMLKPLV